MTFDVAWPAALAALAVIPLFVATARGAWLAGVCRALAVAAVVGALAGLAVERDRPATGACIVAAIDVSGSVGRAGVARARDVLGPLLPALGEDDLVGAVAFAAVPRILAAPGPPSARPLTALLPDSDAGLDPNDTDLAAALTSASALCPEEKQTAVLLVTDGNETTGHVLAEAALAGRRVPVFPLLPPIASLPPVAVRRLLVPRAAPERTFVPVEVVVESREAISAAVSLAIDDMTSSPRGVDLAPGVSVVALPYRASGRGPHDLAARVLLAPERPPAFGAARATLTVTNPVQVLFVTEREAPPAAALALVRRGMDAQVVTPAAFAARARRLDDVHVVVLDDVGRAGLGDETQAALGRWVAAGGALVVTGGEHLFGDPGLVGGPLERILPVELASQKPEPEEREPVAVYLLVDRSNSMGVEDKMEYAKRAALAVLDQLGPRDLVGAIAFDELPYELGPLRPVAESRATLAAQIRQLRHGGGTDFKDALEMAERALLAAAAHVRHVILLTDGDTNRRTADHYALIDDLARSDITVTTIRIGSDTANLDLLNAISRATGGEFHHVEHMETLPQLMIHDTQRQVEASTGRLAGRARVAEGGPMLAGFGEAALPAVAHWAVTRPRADAEMRLVVEAGSRRDPLLVTWTYELGHVAVLPVDFQAGAAGWAVWSEFGRFWTQLVLWAAPRALPEEAGEVAARDPDTRGTEGRATAPARELLERLAALTGGRVDPEPASLLAARRGVARERIPLAPVLVPLALVFVLADVALRRFGRAGM